MKILFLTLVGVLSFVSCGDDDASPNESEQGTWKLVNRIEVGDEQDPIVLDCEKQTTYKFQDGKIDSTIYEANEDEDDCLEPNSTTFNYKIENSLIVILDDEGNPVETGVNVEIIVFEDEMKLIFRDPNDSPTSALKNETFKRQ